MYFQNLSHQSSRFQWPTERLNLTNVSNALKHAAYLERTQFRQLLLDICAEVDDAIRKCTTSSGGGGGGVVEDSRLQNSACSPVGKTR